MFELDREIDAWCRAVIDNHCASSGVLDELKDHMHSLVEEYKRQGRSGEEAFVAAIRQMGESELISAEYLKNGNLLQKLAAYDKRVQRYIGNRFTAWQLGGFQIFWALFCAGLIMLAPVLSTDAAFQENARNWILLIWFIPFSLVAALAAGPHTARCNFRFLGRFFGRANRR